MVSTNPLPTVEIGDVAISRLIIGGNPISGNSHVSPEMDAEMEDYHTVERTKETLWRCEVCGISTMQLRADKHIARMIREYRAEGGTLGWIAQTAPEYDFGANLNLIKRTGAELAYHHGTVTDALYKAGRVSEIRDRLTAMKETLGIPVGLCTHMPEVLLRAEEEGWGADYYMACVYNLSKVDRVSREISGRINNGEPFDDGDIPVMYGAIRAVPKPCLAFKILGATRRCGSEGEVRAALAEAFANIKPTDAVVVGMFQKHSDQVGTNSGIVRDILCGR